jgi:signal transduction histidine kinase
VSSAAGPRAATRLRVGIEAVGGGFAVRVTDDGMSWGGEVPPTMRDRARLAGGRCTVGVDGGEAFVEIWLPSSAPSDG